MLCVGLDPDLEKIPAALKKEKHPLFAFNKEIIEATAEFACAFKPQIAYYSAFGAEKDLELTVQYIKENHPDVVVILDAKRGDIDSTADMYAREAFVRYGADAVTVNPYMGRDTISAFSKRDSHGVFILCRTSNPSGGDLQDLEVGPHALYQVVARKAAREWNAHRNIGLVVGATAPHQMKAIREIAPELPLLVPGVGAQGGSVQEVVSAGRDKNGFGLLINSSRGIIYAGKGSDFAAAAGEAARRLRDEINQARRS